MTCLKQALYTKKSVLEVVKQNFKNSFFITLAYFFIIYNPTRWTWLCCSGTLYSVSTVRNCTVTYTGQGLLGERNTRSCITGHLVWWIKLWIVVMISDEIVGIVVSCWVGCRGAGQELHLKGPAEFGNISINLSNYSLYF